MNEAASTETVRRELQKIRKLFEYNMGHTEIESSKQKYGVYVYYFCSHSSCLKDTLQ